MTSKEKMSNLSQQNSSQNLCTEGFSNDKAKCDDEENAKTNFSSLLKSSKTENESINAKTDLTEGQSHVKQINHVKTNSITSCDIDDIKSEEDPFFPWHDGFRTRESSILSELSITSSLVSSASSCVCNIRGKSKESLSTNSQSSIVKTSNASNNGFRRLSGNSHLDSKKVHSKTSPPVPRPKTLSLSGFTKFWKRNRKNTFPSSPVSSSVPLQTNYTMEDKFIDDYHPSSPRSPSVTTSRSTSVNFYHQHNRSSSNGSDLLEEVEDSNSVPTIQFEGNNNSAVSTPIDDPSPYALWSPMKDETSDEFCKHFSSHLHVDDSIHDFRSLDGCMGDFGKKESKAINIRSNSANINNQGGRLCPTCGKIEREARRKSNSRLSLNLPEIVVGSGRSPVRCESPNRSPTRSFPRFLRSSLSKLIGSSNTSINKNTLDSSKINIEKNQSRDSCRSLFQESDDNDIEGNSIITGINGAVGIVTGVNGLTNETIIGRTVDFDESSLANESLTSPSLDKEKEDDKVVSSPEINGFIPNTPSTQAYLEETRLRELPLIPFAHSSAAIVEKISERTKQIARENSTLMDISPIHSDIRKKPETSEHRSINQTSRFQKHSGESGSNENYSSLSRSHHFPLDNLDLNFQPPEHHTLENLVGLAHQELLQHNEDSTMFELYERDELLTCSSVGSASLTLKSDFVGTHNNNNNFMKQEQGPNVYSHYTNLNRQNNFCPNKDNTDSHMFMDFKNQEQPIFAPQDLERKDFDHKNKCVHPYVEMTRK